MLQKLPVIDQDRDDIKFTEQYVKATDLFIRSLENSSLGRLKKFRAIYQMSRHQQDVIKRLGKAQQGDTRELEDILNKMRSNFQGIMNEFFKLNPSLIDPAFKEIKRRKDPLPDHGQENPVKAEHYFRMLKDDRNPDKKEEVEKITPVQVVNKTSIPVRIIGGERRDDGDRKEERTLRKKFFSFLNYSERGRSSRSIFRGGHSKVAHGISSLISGHGLVNLPNILSMLLVNMFGRLLSGIFTVVMTGLGLLARTLVGRLVTVGVVMLTGVVEKGITKLVEWIFGEDSGIAKIVKGLFESDFWKGAMHGGALGAGLGLLFGPAGVFWGFIIGAIAGLLNAWIENDGPAKLTEGMSKLWDSFKNGIDNFVTAVTKPITDFFKSVENYVKDKLKFLGIGVTDEEKKNNLISENESKKQKAQDLYERSQNSNLPAWQQRELREQAKDTFKSIKSDSQIQNEINSIDNSTANELSTNERVLAKLREKLAREKRPLEREALLRDIELFESKVSATKGMVKPFESPITTDLYNGMIGQKRLDFMSSLGPSITSSPMNIVNSTNVSNSTSNSMSMQLSPLSGDRIK